jgi:hypothetical protein
LKQLILAYRTAFPDLKLTLEDIFAEGEMVAFRWSARGTHLGDWLGIPPTANHVTATGITIFRIAGGKVVESWIYKQPERSSKLSHCLHTAEDADSNPASPTSKSNYLQDFQRMGD